MPNDFPDYNNMTQEEYDKILEELMDESPGSCLLPIPGVYEAVSEHFNNDILSIWEKRQMEEEDY